ncbi:MAG: hypothetical protein ACOYL5_03135 [Phototrophicaceae bacterium]
MSWSYLRLTLLLALQAAMLESCEYGISTGGDYYYYFLLAE